MADLSVVRGIPSLVTPITTEYVMYAFEAVGIYTPIFPRLIKGYSLFATITLYACGYHDITFKKLLQILKFGPSGATTKLLIHYLQCHRAKAFKPYEEFKTNCRHLKTSTVLDRSFRSETISSSPKRERKISDEGYKSEQSAATESDNGELFDWSKEPGWNADSMNNNLDLKKVISHQSGQSTYSLHQIPTPISIWWSEADWASSKSNISTIVSELPNVVNCTKMKRSTFGHLDFLWGRTETLYDDINERLEDRSPYDSEALALKLNEIHDHTKFNPGDMALFWYVKSIIVNTRLTLLNLMIAFEKQFSSVNLF